MSDVCKKGPRPGSDTCKWTSQDANTRAELAHTLEQNAEQVEIIENLGDRVTDLRVSAAIGWALFTLACAIMTIREFV